MTEVLLLVLALLLTVACAVFVAAEFSLTTVERAELERAAESGDRGAQSALKAVRSLTFQLSGAQLGITVTGLIIGMLAKPSIAALLTGPAEAVGLSPAVASSIALVLGTVLSTVVLMVVGELVPKNWAISRPLPVAKKVAGPQRAFSTAFRPPDPAPEQHGQPDPAPDGPGAGRGAGHRARPAGAGRPRPALGQGGRLGGGHRRAVRADPEPGRADRGERDDPARPGHRP
ncbi:hypothetical protein GCM10020000_09290 [Streptomyces olivoverticillatus]